MLYIFFVIEYGLFCFLDYKFYGVLIGEDINLILFYFIFFDVCGYYYFYVILLVLNKLCL